MPVALVIDFNKYKDIYLDQSGIHTSLLGHLLLKVIQENETFEAFSVELVSNYSYSYLTHVSIYTYTYISILYVCVCVCYHLYRNSNAL